MTGLIGKFRLPAIVTVLLVSPAAGAFGRSAPFTIEQVMSAPFPSSLAVAPRGQTAAWVFDTRGVRNIWIGTAGNSGDARSVTRYTKDDGNDLGDLDWSPDARTIAFVRGQTLEDDAPANVDSTPDGPTPRQVWTVAIAGGEPVKIGNGHDPSFSPDGRTLMFLDKHQVLGVDLTGDAKAHPLITDTGTVRSATWSPDGRSIAFVSQRRGHALVGVYRLGDAALTWMTPSFDVDSGPVFAPDGTKLAFIRTPVQKPRPFVARRTGPPWSIWVADVATGDGHTVWTAEAGPGSVFRPTLSADNLLWTTDGHLVFPWEKTGWLLPYEIMAGGGPARALATGPFEMAYMTLDPGHHRLVFASNEADADRLHIWTAGLEGGPARAVAVGDGIEAFPEVASDGTLFALRSGAKAQLAPVVFEAGGWRPLAPSAVSPTFPTASLVVPRSVTFTAADGHDVHGQLFLPPGGAKGRHPAILFFHGGPSRQMLVGFHYMSAYSWMYGLNEYFAAKGYVVLSVNYRGGIGYGLDYREARNFGAGGGSETNDILGAVTYLKGRGDVDPEKLGIWGGSYGGLMTALGLARASGSIAVGVDYAGVYDWPSLFADEGVPIEDAEAKARATASSPVATIGQWHSPVLVVQADDDRNVPFQQSTELVQDLRAYGIPYESMVLPNEVHDLTRYGSWMKLFTATDEYLSRYLGK